MPDQTPGGRPATAGLCLLEINIIIGNVRYRRVISVTINSDRYDPNTTNITCYAYYLYAYPMPDK